MSSKRNITYKCPYCDKRFNKEDLVIHVGNKHDDMIPEGYSAFRVVFDYINKKPAGYNGKCIICGKPSGWDENKGKYNRICSNPECKKKYVQQFEERMLKSKGVKRISSTAEGQTKMLANRKISGEYKFQDGGIKTYTGTYERKALEFMDKVMNIKSEDVSTPGPIMEYMFEGKKHIYISDIYYAPYNLIIEVKDGGNNPNNRNMPEYRAKQIAKEKYIIKNTDFNYLRLTNNDFSQLLAVFMELKMEMSNDTPERVIRINEGNNESYIEEGFLKSEPDILYNKEAFDNGDINICFVTGHSGSGKSTLAHNKEKEDKSVEVYELDDLQCIADRFTMDNLKEYGDLIYTYFKGPGKQFYTTWEKLKEDKTPGKDYEDKLYPGFVAYAIDWAKKHKDKKFILEGVWLFCDDEEGKPYFDPSYFKDYAFYIKGTSAVKSKWRAAKRDMKYDMKEESHNRLFWIKSFTKSFFFKNWKWYKIDEKRIQVFRDYFKNKPETVLSESVLNEAYTKELGKIQKDPEIIDSYGFISSDGIYNENVKIKGFDKWLRGRSELLIIDKGKVYLKKDPKKGYSIPGGGWEKDEDHNLSAIRETNEEARIKVKNVNYVSSYVAYFPPKDWVKERISEENWWYGEYIELYIGEYDGQYKGKVDKIDQDKAMESGKFYDIKSIYNDLIPVHQEALSNIVNESVLLEASISRYKKIKIDRSLIESDPVFKHLREDHCRGYAFYDKDKLVGFVNVEDKEGESWIQALEIMPDYRNQGLGKSILDIAVKELKANYLSVNKKNTVAILMYKKYGFKTYKETETMYFMSLKEELSEASISDYKFLDIKSNKSKALEYLKANSETKSYAEDTIKNYNGELVIYNDTMIGRILIGDKKDKGFITDFYIDEEHRGNKLGSKLIDDAINKYDGIDLLVDKDNKLAIDMYKRRGFVVIKTIKNQYWMKLESKLKEDTDMMNEAMNALLTGYIPGSVDNPNNVYIVNYMQNNVFSDEDPNEDCIGVSSDPLFTNMIIRDRNGILKRVDESFLENKQYKVYIVEKSRDEVNNLISANIGNFVKFGYLYETLTGKKLYTKDQVGLEGVLIPVMDYYESMDTFKEICDNYFFAKDKKEESINEATFIPEEVRYFNNSGLMYSEKVYNIDEYINSKSNKVLEALDITFK